MSAVREFRIQSDPGMLADLQARLAATRFADAVTDDWSYGMERGFLRDLLEHWRLRYDWGERLQSLNGLPHRWLSTPEGGIHFLHFAGSGARPVPLLLMNGWPSSFIEYRRLAPMLARGSPSFDVVVPAMPGFGFSTPMSRPYGSEPSQVFPDLMSALGYDRFVVSGTDIGAGTATRIALAHPGRVIAVHVSSVATKPVVAGGVPTEAETAYAERVSRWMVDEGGYQAIQSSRPQTLGFALADSPAGLASWVIEKFRAWSDCGGDVLSVWPIDDLIDNLMIYWITNTIASSLRYYFEATRLRPPLPADAFVRSPTGVAMWPADIALAPRELAERLYAVRQYGIMPAGGHFPAWERPELYAEDLRRLVVSCT